jgi:hypothetical protein
MTHSNESHARRAEEKLRLAKQSHMLKMYQTLVIHESLTASNGERALAERKLRRQFFFFSNLGDEKGTTCAEDDNAAEVVDGTRSIPVGNTSSTSPDHVE